ncbi:MAG: class II fructose-bisphosphate aldolase [Candidatus Acetothermia bacterium]|jgi:fructose-bisphosphate aldolase class II|nr:class II fructose-bisphosphate aldolase [Candidatus Acetothermia bacterium]
MAFLSGRELAQVYRRAKADGYALIANNFAEPNVLLGILAAYEGAKSDLLLQVSMGAAKFAGGGKPLPGLRALVRYVQALAAEVRVGVFVNLDHVTPDHVHDFIRPAVAEGLCASVMIDASALPFEENVAATKRVVELARPYGALVEGELGKIKGVEDEIASDEAFYTDPDEAAEYVERTGVDLLAISVGTQHGVSTGRELTLRTDLARAIDARLREDGMERPLVLHGASGLSAEQVRALVAAGVCKVNKDTTYQYVYARAAADFFRVNRAAILPPEGTTFDPITFDSSGRDWKPDKKLFDPREVGKVVQAAIRAVAAEMINQVGSGGKSLYA